MIYSSTSSSDYCKNKNHFGHFCFQCHLRSYNKDILNVNVLITPILYIKLFGYIGIFQNTHHKHFVGKCIVHRSQLVVNSELCILPKINCCFPDGLLNYLKWSKLKDEKTYLHTIFRSRSNCVVKWNFKFNSGSNSYHDTKIYDHKKYFFNQK